MELVPPCTRWMASKALKTHRIARTPRWFQLALLILFVQKASAVQGPPNEPATITLEGQYLTVLYDGSTLFEARIINSENLRSSTLNTYRDGDAVTQVLTLIAGDQKEVQLSGIVTAGDQAFAAESDPPVQSVPIVRHTSGLSHSLRNQAVYNRERDWVISVDSGVPNRTRVVPLARQRDGVQTFSLESSGTEIVLRFRPRFYQRHRGLRFYEPWNYDVWRKPIAGWVSWFAFRDNVTESDIKHTADVMNEVLKPYGYEYLQLDDGYQSGMGPPSLWLKANARFPSGLPALADYIRSKGLKPGLWTAATFADSAEVQAHQDWFVREQDKPVYGNWIDYVLDASNSAALDAVVRPLYRELRQTHWDYFKVDALRHLRYDGYNAHADYFRRKGVDITDTYRRYVQTIRDEIGPDHFMLACWGIRPELVGIVDAVRIGRDGFSFAGLAQYNSLDNVVWRNDPDHIELSEREAWRSTTVTSLTGSLFMLTDKPERYHTAFVEPAKRTVPVLFTVPGQLYDVDASRSKNLWQVDSETSGLNPEPFDASLTPAVHLYQLDIARPFENWTVLGRIGGTADDISFEGLGLDSTKEYFVYEFWTKQLRGSFTGSFAPGALDPFYNAQVFIIRERLTHPQILSTGRHITGGGVDLRNVRWANNVLEGTSDIVQDDPYEITLTEPPGYTLEGASCGTAERVRTSHVGTLVKILCRSGTSQTITWTARYKQWIPH